MSMKERIPAHHYKGESEKGAFFMTARILMELGFAMRFSRS
jgi:hypothetical protein